MSEPVRPLIVARRAGAFEPYKSEREQRVFGPFKNQSTGSHPLGASRLLRAVCARLARALDGRLCFRQLVVLR